MIRNMEGAPMLTVADVARDYAVSKATVHRWVRVGILTPAVRVDHVIRFTREGVERDLAEATQKRSA